MTNSIIYYPFAANCPNSFVPQPTLPSHERHWAPLVHHTSHFNFLVISIPTQMNRNQPFWQVPELAHTHKSSAHTQRMPRSTPVIFYLFRWTDVHITGGHYDRSLLQYTQIGMHPQILLWCRSRNTCLLASCWRFSMYQFLLLRLPYVLIRGICTSNS